MLPLFLHVYVVDQENDCKNDCEKNDERRFDEIEEFQYRLSYLRCITKSAERPTKIAKQIHSRNPNSHPKTTSVAMDVARMKQILIAEANAKNGDRDDNNIMIALADIAMYSELKPVDCIIENVSFHHHIADVWKKLRSDGLRSVNSCF